MRCAPDVADQLQAVAGQFDFLSKTMLEAAGLDVTAPHGSVSFSMGDADGYLPVADLVDVKRESAQGKGSRKTPRLHQGSGKETGQ